MLADLHHSSFQRDERFARRIGPMIPTVNHSQELMEAFNKRHSLHSSHGKVFRSLKTLMLDSGFTAEVLETFTGVTVFHMGNAVSWGNVSDESIGRAPKGGHPCSDLLLRPCKN